MADFADLTALQAAWRPLTSTEQAQATKLLAYASQRIRNRVPGIDAAIANGSVDPLTAEMVTVAMVKRAMISPLEGVTQTTDTAGPFSEGTTYANPMGNLYLTDDEIRDLGGVPNRSKVHQGWLA